MRFVAFGLLCEGTSDRAALPPLVEKALVPVLATAGGAEWSFDSLAGWSSDAEVRRAAMSGAYDVLLVHRDGAGAPKATRKRILALASGSCPVVPVREVEAWLLADPEATRRATNAPRSVTLPSPRRPRAVEREPDPKRALGELLALCLGATPSRDDGIDDWYRLIAQEVDGARLLQVPWYRQFADDLEAALTTLPWWGAGVP